MSEIQFSVTIFKADHRVWPPSFKPPVLHLDRKGRWHSREMMVGGISHASINLTCGTSCILNMICKHSSRTKLSIWICFDAISLPLDKLGPTMRFSSLLETQVTAFFCEEWDHNIKIPLEK